MATIVNKRQHQLRDGAVLLLPGENTVDDEVWQQTNVKGSQLEQWQRLNWVAQKRSLPVAQEPAAPATVAAQPQLPPAQPAQPVQPAASARASGAPAALAGEGAAADERDLPAPERGRRGK